MSKTVISTTEAPSAIGPYSQAIKAGNMLFVSGQIPIDPATGQLISSTIEAETHRAMKNIGAILQAAGLGYEHIVKTGIFLKSMNDFATVNEAYASYFTSDFPARETVEVARLPKDARVEISVVAVG